MGSVSAMDSIDRVLAAHGDQLRAELMEDISPLVKGVELENKGYSIQAVWILTDGGELDGPALDIDDLAERFPDCEVGY